MKKKFLMILAVLVIAFGYSTISANGALGTVAQDQGTQLHEPHRNTETECTNGVIWHFVHNQTEAESGIITVDFGGFDVSVSNGEPFSSNILHYWVWSYENSFVDAYDNVEGGNLILSHYTCKEPDTSTTTTTTTVPDTTSTISTTVPVTTTIPATTTTNVTTTSTTIAITTTVPTTTTVPLLECLEAGEEDPRGENTTGESRTAIPYCGDPDFTG